MKVFALLFALAIAPNIATFAQQTTRSAVLLELSQPVYPSLARQANIYGDVSIAVAVHPDGKTDVAFESGHQMLRQAAVDSAQKTRFECRGCDSVVTYHLLYSFRLARGRDCCTSMSVPAQVAIEQQSGEQNGQLRTQINITADEICLCDAATQLTKRSRSLKCLYLWKCS